MYGNNRFAPYKSDSEIRAHEKSYVPKGFGFLIFLLIILAAIVVLTLIYGSDDKVERSPESMYHVEITSETQSEHSVMTKESHQALFSFNLKSFTPLFFSCKYNR